MKRSIYWALLLMICCSCGKAYQTELIEPVLFGNDTDPTYQNAPVSLTTLAATTIGVTSAQITTMVGSLGRFSSVELGVLLVEYDSVNGEPVQETNDVRILKTVINNKGSYQTSFTNLNSLTRYKARSYIRSGTTIYYGNTISFVTFW